MKMTKRGAAEVTSMIDRLAGLVQDQYTTLGLGQSDAIRVATVLDALSDQIEKKAGIHRAGLDRSPVDETGNSVDHGENGFDPNAIADQVPGPQEIVEPPPHDDIDNHFKQDHFQELRRLQQSGTLESNAASGRILTKNASRRIACSNSLSAVEDQLKILYKRISGSDIDDVSSVAPSIKSQITAVGKIRDYMLDQQAYGILDASDTLDIEQVLLALQEELPFLEEIAAGFNNASPVDAYNFMKKLNDGSLVDLIDVATSMVEEQADRITEGGDEEEEDDASMRLARVKPKKAASKSKPTRKMRFAEEEPKKGEPKKGEPKEEEEDTSDEDSADEDSAEDPPKESSKKASFYGFNLFKK